VQLVDLVGDEVAPLAPVPRPDRLIDIDGHKPVTAPSA
jgi:hypothetical protein